MAMLIKRSRNIQESSSESDMEI